MRELLQKVSTRIVEKSGYSKDKSDKHGEVFTPVELINEMLDKLPGEVWKDKTKTFYDPCAGKGNFPIEIVKRLFDSLEEEIEDPEERLRHIIENQIFMSEYQKESAEFCDTVFTFGKDFKVNIYYGDSLILEETHWGFKPDIVIGNPPYQDPGSKTQTNKLWIKFIEKFYEEASEYLYFITPDPWTHPLSSRSKYKKIFRECRLLLANVGECAKHFPGIGSSFTYFLLSKIDERGSTTLTTKEGTVEIDFPSTPWIPNVLDKDSIEILKRTLWSEGDRIEFTGSQLPKKYHSKGQTEVYQYPFCLSTSTTSWREEKCKYHNSPKIMFPYLASHTKPILDLGELGATHGVNLIFDTEEEATEAYQYYLQEDIQRALQLSKWHHGNANPQVLKSLPKKS